MPIIVNMTKAREIHLAEIRRVRDRELAAEDIKMLQAIESNDTGARSRIGKRKQELRDMPQRLNLDAPRTAEALYRSWPANLERA
jgi:hypothetical protein